MEMVTDYKTLLKLFNDTKLEHDEAKDSYRILTGYSRNKESNFSEDREKKPIIVSRHFPSQRTANKRPRLYDSSESTEESACDDELPSKKVGLQSTVIVKIGSSKRKKDVICKQNIKVQSRNRRILGMLQSTLQKFQDEAVKRQPQDLKRKKVEQKVEAAKEEEKHRMKREKDELYLKTKEKKLQLECLEQMMAVTKLFETWRCNQNYMLNFIRTKTEPRICFLPASLTSSSKKCLEKSKVEIKGNIEKQRAAMEKEIAKIRESYQPANPIGIEENSAFLKIDNDGDISKNITATKKCNYNESLTLQDDELLYSD